MVGLLAIGAFIFWFIRYERAGLDKTPTTNTNAGAGAESGGREDYLRDYELSPERIFDGYWQDAYGGRDGLKSRL